ncbi:polyphosphate kinase 1 [Halovenus rubra]|uniref:Polyphosphate kinase n=2 Tax=Halovenus rubra TaxID=869890 RepID=A0ABD5XA99_9EURY|nr:polyphosphate kinase 1 [Halovenus rubra]
MTTTSTMADKRQQYDCFSCGRGFETRAQLRGHVNNGHTECEWVDDDTVDLRDTEYYLSRELSKLEFNGRVLAEATDERNPLFERVKFLSIFTQNMDEFFMKRVGGLEQQRAANITATSPDGRTPDEQWRDVLAKAGPLLNRQAQCYHDQLRPALAEAGIDICEYEELSAKEQEDVNSYFESSVLPTLTPLTIDSAKPFPHISNLSLSLGVLTQQTHESEPTFSRVKIPKNRPRLVQVGETTRYVPLEQVVAANLSFLFPNVDVIEHATFRATRNAEVRRNEEIAEDLVQRAEEVIERRQFATVVRLEITETMSERMLDTLLSHLDVDERAVFRLAPPLDFRDFDQLLNLDRPDLTLDEWTPQPHPRLSHRGHDSGESIFEEIKRDDALVHHPYHSFDGTVQRFLDEAAHDPDVLAIKAAIYRTASDSQIIQRLIDAAKNGKQVAVMVELKARFDEENNLEWAQRLEEEGIHVAYGTIGYKTHTKTTLVVREEDDGVELYSHVSTGNYHSETAKRYEDLGLFTSNRDIGQDLVKLFNYFTGHSLHNEYRDLLIAPGNMRERFVELIQQEAKHAHDGKEARIVAKVNRLEDPGIIRELYRASRAGVNIDLIVRDICRLRPGLAGVSDNITVHSIINRFLEHSRIYYFHDDGADRYFIGSADWMERNLDNRVEAVTPIHDTQIQRRLQHVLDLCLTDNDKSWELHPDGSYSRQTPDDDESIRNAQAIHMREARETHPN